MAHLYLIRHASTKITEEPPEKWPLSKEGERNAAVLAEKKFWSEVEIIFSSPESKAYLTALPAAQNWNIPIERSSCLREVYRLRFITDYQKTVARFFAMPGKSIKEWEPASFAEKRINDCIQNIIAIHAKKNMAVVSHGLVLSLFLAGLKNRYPLIEEWNTIPFPGVAIIDSKRGKLIKPWSNLASLPD